MAKEPKLYTTIQGLDPSEKIRADLAADGQPVLVAFSCGKDAICTELALRESGVETKLAYLYYIPGLAFIEDGIKSLEDQLQKPIARYPHPSLYRWLGLGIFQTPDRAEVVAAAQLVKLDYDMVWDLAREDLGLPADTLLADGVRANDSQQRRMAFTRYGALKRDKLKVSPIWDWSLAKIRATLDDHHIELPVDYEWFGRSFDGLDQRFLAPIAEHAPEDFERIRSWFPLAGMELIRHGL